VASFALASSGFLGAAFASALGASFSTFFGSAFSAFTAGLAPDATMLSI
jgi:hypothetical protein